MRYTIHQIKDGEDELILNYQQLNEEVEAVLVFMEKHQKKVMGKCDGEIALLFFYCIYRLCVGLTVADILHMAEMIFLTYVVGYLQVFLLWNFDEADRLGKRELFGIALCTAIYTAVSYICGWFDKNVYVTMGFAAYVIFLYVCVYLVYKCRRKIDDKILNSDLELFKTRSQKEP